MTSLLMILTSIAVALGFARYNKSNKLFWILLVGLLGGFTAKNMIDSAFVDHVKSEASVVKSTPAPTLAPTCSFKALETEEGDGTFVETKPMGKDSAKVDTLASISLGEDEHLSVLTQPPQLEGLKTNFMFDTS